MEDIPPCFMTETNIFVQTCYQTKKVLLFLYIFVFFDPLCFYLYIEKKLQLLTGGHGG